MSNRLIDILDDEKVVGRMNEDFHYKQSVIPRLEKLMKLIHENHATDPKDYGFVHDLRYDLKDNPQHRVTKLEMTHCNKLWKKYKV